MVRRSDSDAFITVAIPLYDVRGTTIFVDMSDYSVYDKLAMLKMQIKFKFFWFTRLQSFCSTPRKIDLWRVRDAVKASSVWYYVFDYCDGVVPSANNAVWSGCLYLELIMLFRHDGVFG